MPKLRNYYSWISLGLDASISDSRILLIWNLIYILGLQFHVAVDNDRDIISIDWISECINSKMLLPISPRLIISTRRKSRQTNILIVYPFLNAFPLSVYRHYLFQSRTTKEKLNMDIDAYGDPWFEDVAKDDLLQVSTLDCSCKIIGWVMTQLCMKFLCLSTTFSRPNFRGIFASSNFF